MAKPLDPKAIEAERQTSSRAERREQKRRQMQDEISYNQRGNGVIIIPPQKRRELAEEPPKLRVAAYCRVSTQEEQQVGSFDMQIHHFTKRIEANPQWELVEIYQDEGISATTVEKRLGFQKMIADAVAGKIDLILTKSISRFGRNIVDILDNLRTLSALNPPVSVEFETEGIRRSVSQVDSHVILRGSTFKLPSFRLLLLPSYLDAHFRNGSSFHFPHKCPHD